MMKTEVKKYIEVNITKKRQEWTYISSRTYFKEIGFKVSRRIKGPIQKEDTAILNVCALNNRGG